MGGERGFGVGVGVGDKYFKHSKSRALQCNDTHTWYRSVRHIKLHLIITKGSTYIRSALQCLIAGHARPSTLPCSQTRSSPAVQQK